MADVFVQNGKCDGCKATQIRERKKYNNKA